VRDEFPMVRYIREPVAGLDFARNRALRDAKGDVVAFLDDDAVADPDWVEATARAFAATPALGACTGHVAALGSGTEGERLFEANGGFARGTRAIHLPSGAHDGPLDRRAPLIAWSISIGSGCSMAVRRQLVLDLGGFDEALDLGDALPGGGDLDILWRVLDAGHDVRYDPAVRARHEHRADAESAIRQICGHNRALIAWLTKCVARARGRTRLEVLAFLLWRLTKPGVRLVRRAVGRDPLPAPVLLRLWLQSWRGLFAYAPARRLATRRRTGAARVRSETRGTAC
jgi:GT2 family glycosyltransferase